MQVHPTNELLKAHNYYVPHTHEVNYQQRGFLSGARDNRKIPEKAGRPYSRVHCFDCRPSHSMPGTSTLPGVAAPGQRGLF